MATREIKTKMALEGEQKFKSAMKDAAGSIKVLNSQEKLAKAQFKATGDAQKYNAQQAEILKKKIEEQRKSVKAAEDAVKQLTENGIRENDRTMQQWQIRLNESRTSLASMEAQLNSLNASAADSAKGTQQLSESINSIGKTVSLDAVRDGLSSITDGIGAGIGRVKDLALGLVNELVEAASWADDIETKALMWGMDQDTLQRMYMVADSIDTPVEAIISARAKLAKALKSGSKDMRETFLGLGIYSDKYEYGTFDDLTDMFWEIGDAIMHIDESSKEDVAQKIFGKSWKELVPLFTAGREAYEEAMKAQQTVSEENMNNLSELDDKINDFQNRLEVLKNSLLGELAPELTSLTDRLTKFVTAMNEYLASEEGQQALAELRGVIHDLISDLTNVDDATAVDVMKTAINSIKDALVWVKDHHEDVANGIKVIVGAWALGKVGTGLLTMLSVINGLRNLTGSEARRIARNISTMMGGGASAAAGESIGGAAAAAPAAKGAARSFGTGVVSTLTSAIPQLSVAALFGYGTYKLAEANDAQYTAHVNEIADSVDEVTKSTKGANEEVDKLAAQLLTLKTIYLEERGGDAWKDLDMDLIGRVAPDSGLMKKVGEYGSLDKWLGSGEPIAAQSWSLAEELIGQVEKYMAEAAKKAQESSAQIPEKTAKGIETGKATATSAVDQMGADAEAAVQTISEKLKQATYKTGTDMGTSAAEGTRETTPDVVAAVDDMATDAEITMDNAAGPLADASARSAAAFADGFISALEAKIAPLEKTTQRFAAAASKMVNQELEIKSPSRVAFRSGAFFAEGFINGLDSQLATVNAAAERMAGAATLQPQSGMMGLTGGRGMVDVTLMIGPDRLAEVLVPLINDEMGAQLAQARR